MFNLFNLFKKKIKESRLSTIEEHLGWEAGADPKFIKLLEQMCNDDKDRHFIASNDRARDMVMGAYLRNRFLIKQLTKYSKLTIMEKKGIIKGRPKMNLPRYGE